MGIKLVERKEGVRMVYVCSNCYRIHDGKNLAKDDDGKLYCSRPGCDCELVEIDEMIMPVILMLWEKGYDTVSCCSGHFSGNTYNVPYIIFAKTGRQDFFLLPEGFLLKECKGGKILEPENYTKIPDMHEIFKRNDNLLHWAEEI